MRQTVFYTGISTALALFCLTPVVASANPITGTFNIAGTITVSQSGTTQMITWLNDVAPFAADKAVVGSTGLTGSFAGLGGTNVTIRDLTNPPDVVDGAGFPSAMFITFDAAPALGPLMINFIAQGVNNSAQCGLAPAVGQTCAIPNSPFDFQNTPGGGSRAGFVFTGNTPENTWTGNFTSQFNVPFQTVFAQLGTTGSVTNTYSATFTVTPGTTFIPEPGSLLLGLTGIGAMVAWRRKRA